MAKTDGGPAFPRTSRWTGDEENGASGMSHRDWLAGQALVGLAPLCTGMNAISAEEAGELCYMLATEVLKVKEKREKRER